MTGHIPVLLQEVIDYLHIVEGGFYLDGTFGAGGYTSAILKRCEFSKVLAIDRDPNVQIFVNNVSSKFPGRFTFVNKKFSELNSLLTLGNIELDGAVFDLGVSSMQLATLDRGFSFMHDAPLDMRMGKNKFSAYDVVNKAKRHELEDILLNLGEEYKYKQIVEKILDYRKKSQIKTTLELANIVKSVYKTRKKIHPATKTFQAIRIFVNDELSEIREMLDCVRSHLKVGARLVVVSFHSLEDRIIKNYFRDSDKNVFNILTKKPETAKEEEVRANSRARSAKLRVLERIG